MTETSKKRMIKWGKGLVLGYAGIGVLLYALQDYFLFHPVKLPENYQYKFDVLFEEVTIPFNKTDTVSMVKFFTKAPVPKGVVIYLHGNRGNINRYAKFAANFTKHGYEVWMEDYPGFGKSTGARSEAILYQQAQHIYAMAAATFNSSKIIIYGKSLGTGIAAQLASVNNCRQLILETPYYNIPELAGYYAPIYPTLNMTAYKMYTDQYLPKVKAPITIFHGTNDWVIPYSNAVKLKAVLKPTDEFITIPNGTHHNLSNFPAFHQKLDSLLTQ